MALMPSVQLLNHYLCLENPLRSGFQAVADFGLFCGRLADLEVAGPLRLALGFPVSKFHRGPPTVSGPFSSLISL